MTIDEKIEIMTSLLGDDDSELCKFYLLQAKEKILNKLYPYDTEQTKVPERYSNLEIELAIALYNQRGIEGQNKHTENGISRSWRSETEILGELTPFAGIPL